MDTDSEDDPMDVEHDDDDNTLIQVDSSLYDKWYPSQQTSRSLYDWRNRFLTKTHKPYRAHELVKYPEYAERVLTARDMGPDDHQYCLFYFLQRQVSKIIAERLTILQVDIPTDILLIIGEYIPVTLYFMQTESGGNRAPGYDAIYPESWMFEEVNASREMSFEVGVYMEVLHIWEESHPDPLFLQCRSYYDFDLLLRSTRTGAFFTLGLKTPPRYSWAFYAVLD